MYFFNDSARTAKAPYWQKVELLFNFFKDDKDNGIKFNSFTKMVPRPLDSSTTTPEIKSKKYSPKTSEIVLNSIEKSNAVVAPTFKLKLWKSRYFEGVLLLKNSPKGS